MTEITPSSKMAALRLPGFLAALSRSQLLLLTIMATGALFRFAFLGQVQHGYDQAYPAYDALRMLDGRQLVLLGQPSSVFLDNPPLMAYLQTLPLLAWRSIWSVYLFVTALNTVAIWFVYRAARKLMDEPVALVAAALFAISPWVVHFSRLTWVQGLLPLFTAVVAWGLWPTLVVEQGRGRRVFIALLALTAIIQSYILGFALLGPVAALAIIFHRRIPRRALIAGGAVLLTTMVFFGLTLSLAGGRNSSRFATFFANYEFTLNVQALEHAIRFVTGMDYAGQAPETADFFWRGPLSRAAHLLLSAALLAGVVRALLALRRDSQERRLAVVLLLWFLIPVAGLMLLPYLVHPHYLMLSLPAGHLLAAWGVAPLARRRRPRFVVAALLVAVAALFWLNLDRGAQAAAANSVAASLEGITVADAASAGAIIRDLVPENTSSTAHRVVTDANTPLVSSVAARLLEALPGPRLPDLLLLPGEDPLLYVLVNQPPVAVLPVTGQSVSTPRRLEVAGGTTFSFQRLPPFDGPQALALAEIPVEWSSDAGLTLLGYGVETPPVLRAGDSVVVTSFWRVQDLHPQRDEWLVSPFFQVLDEGWQLMANVSAEGQWGDSWELGDVFVYRTLVPLPDYVEPGPHQLAIGLSDVQHGTAFSLNAPDGPAPFFLTPLVVGE